MTLKLAFTVTGNAASLKQAAGEARQEVRSLGDDNSRATQAMTAANDQAVTSIRRVTEALTGQSAAQRMVNQLIVQRTDNWAKSRGDDIAAYGAELDRLRAKFNPLFAVISQYKTAQAELRTARRQGAISADEYAAAMSRERQSTLDAIAAAKGRKSAFQTSGGYGQFAGVMAGQQVQDVIIAAQMGQGLGTIGLQQGLQLGSGLQLALGEKGGAGAGKLLLSTLTSIINPINAVAIGATVAGAALVQWLTSGEDKAKTLDEALDAHRSNVKAVADAYGLTGVKIDEMARKSRIAADAAIRDSGKQAQDLAEKQRRELINTLATSRTASVTAVDPMGESFLEETVFTVRGKFAAFRTEIDSLVAGINKGAPDFETFERSVEAVARQNPQLRAIADEIIRAARGAADAAYEIDRINKSLAYQRDLSPADRLDIIQRQGRQTLDDARIQREMDVARDLFERQADYEARLAQIRARSVDDRVKAARSAEGARHIEGEVPAIRQQRIELAGALELKRAEQENKEARDERFRQAEAGIGQMQLELLLIGKTAGEQAALRFEYERMAELRDLAARTGFDADEAEKQMIREKAAEYRKYADEVARAQLGRELQFERDQIFRSPTEQNVASRMRSAGLDVDLDSYYAGIIRANEQLKENKALWEDIRDVGRNAIDTLTDVRSWDDLEQWVSSFAEDALKQFQQLAFANPLKNAIYGDNAPTLENVGGLGGFIGALLGGETPGAEAVGAMTVNAGTVVISGQLGLGDGKPLIDTILNPANDNNGASARPTTGGGVAGQIWNFFSGKGLKDFQVAAILGHAQAESGFNPLAKGDGGNAFGLFQWNDRRHKLFDFLGGQKNLSNVGGQLNFAWKELQTSERGALQKLLSSRNLREATAAWGGFERPSGYSASNPEAMHNWSGRLKNAEAALGKFGGAANAATSQTASLGAGMGELGKGFSSFGDQLQKFMSSAQGGGSGWFQGLTKLFGGAGGAFGWMNAISPMATQHILAGGVGLFDKGGYTGAGDPSDVAGLVHRDEFVFDAPATRTLGVGFLDGLRRAARSGKGFMSGGYAGPQIVSSARAAATFGQAGVPKVEIKFENRGTPQRQVEQREESDGQGGRRSVYVLEDMVDQAMTRPGSRANKTLSARGAKAGLVRT